MMQETKSPRLGLEQPTDRSCELRDRGSELRGRNAIFITRSQPGSMRSGDGLYSNCLIETFAALTSKVEVLCYCSSEASHPKTAGVTVSTLTKGRWSLFRYIFSLNTKSGTAVATRENRSKLLNVLVKNNPDLIIIDHIDQTWALSVLKIYRHQYNKRAAIIYATHNEEGSSRLSIARRAGFPRAVLYLLDSLRAKLRDRQLIDAVDVVTCICERDRDAYKKMGHPNVIVIHPSYYGAPRASRTITVETPRRIVVVGSFLWSAKRLSLFSFLREGERRLRSAGVGIAVVGQMRLSDLIRLRKMFPHVVFTGEIDSLEPYLAVSRLGLLIDQSGGGFKLTSLTYALSRTPIAAIATALPGSSWETHCLVAVKVSDLIGEIISNIDNLPKLNDIQNRMFDFATNQMCRENNLEELAHALQIVTLGERINVAAGSM